MDGGEETDTWLAGRKFAVPGAVAGRESFFVFFSLALLNSEDDVAHWIANHEISWPRFALPADSDANVASCHRQHPVTVWVKEK